VQKSRAAQESILESAASLKAEVICLQEPWLINDVTREKTATLRGYRTLAPINTWGDREQRPRVLTLLRDTIKIARTSEEGHPDVLGLLIELEDGRTIDILNIYNAGANSSRAREAERLIRARPIYQNSVYLGDFNLHHPLWDSRYSRLDDTAIPLAEWALRNNLVFLNNPELATHIRGNVLDLGIISNNLNAAAQLDIRYDLATGADHYPLECTLDFKPRRQGTSGFRDADKVDADAISREGARLRNSLKEKLANTLLSTIEGCDSLVDSLEDLILALLNKIAKRKPGPLKGNIWWSTAC